MNQHPEQLARDKIDQLLLASGWVIQSKSKINLAAGLGVAIREYQTDIGPADYVLFVNSKPVGIIEAKREEEGEHLTVHEEQSEGYATAKLKYLNNDKLSFAYESTGEITYFIDYRDQKPQLRKVFTFHRPETFAEWLKLDKSLRTRLHDMPVLTVDGLREHQVNAITNLEMSLKEARPKALIQMATGSGRTFTAITFIYRLLKFAKAKRILFLVDNKNLSEYVEKEFMAYIPNDDNRKFTELYMVTRLKSSHISGDNQVYISTIQRMYSILKGTELGESTDEGSPNERSSQKEAMPVVYNENIPIEFFDFIVVDECHRSIYNFWKQVLDYFDVFQIGLSATPDNRTLGYFNQNLVSSYEYEKAVLDGILVPSKQGSIIGMREEVEGIKGPGTAKRKSSSPVLDEKKDTGTNYIIAIGIDEYKNASLNLPNCVKDCKDVINAFQMGFQRFEVYRTLYNEEATRQSIIDAIDSFSNDEKCNNEVNNLVIFFSGHGDFVEAGERNIGSWVPHDYTSNKKKEYLRIDHLRDELEFVKTCHILVVADCCFAGEIHKNNIRIFNEPINKNKDSGENKVIDVGLEPSRYGLAACRSNQKTGAGEVGINSVFTAKFIEALQKNVKMELRFSIFAQSLRETFNAGSGQRVEYEKLHISQYNTGDFTLYGNESHINALKRSKYLEEIIYDLNYNNQKDEFDNFNINRTLTLLSGTYDCGLNFVIRQLKNSMSFPSHHCWLANAQFADGTDEQLLLNLFKMAGKIKQEYNDLDELRNYLVKQLQVMNLFVEIRFYPEAASLGDITQKRKRIIEDLAKFSESVNSLTTGDKRLCIFIIDFENADYTAIVPNKKISQTEAIIFEKVEKLKKTEFLKWYDLMQRPYRKLSGMKSEFNDLFDNILYKQVEDIFPESKEMPPGYVIRKICLLSGCPELADELLN